MAQPAALRRDLSLPLMVLYDLGTTIGAGIYALGGKVAGIAGMNAPLAFLIASALAGFTAFSFSTCCSRPFRCWPCTAVSTGFLTFEAIRLLA